MHIAPPTSAADLRALVDASLSVGAPRERLHDLLARAGRVGDEVRWEAPSARAFDDAADEVCRILRSAADLVDEVARALGRAAACGVLTP